MSENDHDQDIPRLRRYVADLEAENALLKGAAVPSASAAELRARNAELRRSIAEQAEASGQASGQDADHVSVQQAAAMLNVSTWQVLRELRESLPLSTDAGGRAVIARGDIDAYLRARAQGRCTRRFL